jgi:hypothetical protein
MTVTRFKDKAPLKTLAKAAQGCSAQVSRRDHFERPITGDRCTAPPSLYSSRYAHTCAHTQSLAYGKCIGQSYQEVSKGMCEAEFRAFKECVQVRSLAGQLALRGRPGGPPGAG